MFFVPCKTRPPLLFSSQMTATLASIDIGSYTTRLLIARMVGPSGPLRSLIRNRVYTRLSEGFDRSGSKILLPEAIERTLDALHDFLGAIRMFDVQAVHAIATGVVREAVNRTEFLDRVLEHTGIIVRPISGKEEALLTGKGALNAVSADEAGSLVFDLGGGSTEFFFSGGSNPLIGSLPLGASILTQEYIKSDPPNEKEVHTISRHVDRFLRDSMSGIDYNGSSRPHHIVGTGGTVTTLGAMLFGIPLTEITEDRINGLILKRKDIEALFSRMLNQGLRERLRLTGLDRERASVILAGSLVVLKILYYFRSLQLTASMSDLLEGIIIHHFEGEKNG